LNVSEEANVGARGPAPQKAELRILKGNGKDRDQAHKPVRRQPKAALAAPPMPTELGDHGERIWKHVTPELARMGILGSIDLATLEAYCRAYQAMRDHDGGRGYMQVLIGLANLGSKLGLDPASRLRMTLPEAPNDEEGDIFGTG
jgi:phage terminase small subunit